MFIPDEIYKQIIKYAVIPTVDILFLDKDKRILLWLRKNEPLQWVYYIPGWRIQKNETLLQAAQRKGKEELNIDIDTTKLRFAWVYDDIFDNSAFAWLSTHCLSSLFVYPLDADTREQIHPDDQHSDIQFFAYDDPSLHSFIKQRLEKVQSDYHIFI